MIKDNKLGGINEMDKHALERAKKVDLITLPKAIVGTNCYNCKWIKKYEEDESDNEGDGMCVNPKVRQLVNERMCCVLWTNKGEYRPFKREKKLMMEME